MRWLKKLLICIYSYTGIFFAATLVLNACGITVQDTLIAGVAAGIGVESIITGLMKIKENADERRRMKLEGDINDRHNTDR